MELISFEFTDARFRVEEFGVYLGSLDCGVQRLGQGLQQKDFQGKFLKRRLLLLVLLRLLVLLLLLLL